MTTKKKTPTKKAAAVQTIKLSELLETLLAAIHEKGRSDPTKPGLVLSQLSDGVIYGSIVRYTGTYGAGKTIMHSWSAPTVVEVLKVLGKKLLQPTANERLERILR